MVAEVNSTLKKLDLSHNDLHGGGAKAISEPLRSNSHGLISLNLSCNGFTLDDMDMLRDMLGHTTCRQIISLEMKADELQFDPDAALAWEKDSAGRSAR